jgi:hypothetical protein
MDQKQRSIAEKYSLDYYRRPLPTRAWKSPWSYFALLLALLALGGMYLAGRNTTFQAAPVANVHSSFGTDCASCHDQAWGPALRLTSLSDVHRSVSDLACQECHRAARHASIELTEPACAACHQEHRPEKRLVDVADSACVRCHRDLTEAGVSEVSFAPKILQFETGAGSHPEFSFFRQDAKLLGPQHQAGKVARFIDQGQGAGRWLDRGGLKFNHKVHLDPAGVLNAAREPTKLSCSDCHVSEPDSRFMAPIAYEQHCAKCHPLSAAAPLAIVGNLPHSTIEEVRGTVRERLARQMEESASRMSEKQSDARLPRLPHPARITADQDRQLSRQMELADHAIFGLEAKGMCRKCHHVVERGNQWHVLLENPDVSDAQTMASRLTEADMVPARWMHHATFNHNSHRAVKCSECHQADNSTATTDILLPSIAVCRTCHGDGGLAPSMRVRADCVLCHTYHSESHSADFEGVPLKLLFPQADTGSTNTP